MMFARRHSGQTALRAGRSLLPQYHPMTQPVLPASLRTMQTVINLQSKETKEQAIDFERQILNPERTETCKSGSDDEVGHHKCSYDPSTTTPESEYLADEAESLLDGKGHHPLFVSPANLEVSHYIDPMSEGAVQGAARLGPSGKGWTRKHREVHIKDVPGSQYERYEKLLQELRKPKQRFVSPLCFILLDEYLVRPE
ncbi:unnamed protein product [Aspergillus oryzae]|uniref:Unnamed protein product n=4 Tax=Aspergillus subgen. Circumdati TaxID=2720871 RepID=A0AAN4YCF6_ASPOZ|nr:unnamed protein product [Aspergillus oryzae]GMF95063.1 unnamed protein product [Aspergillus oryzae]GMG07245.1 unnamed protein product [Aspergillus oryzae]GMG24067.1 unnamed protein product [Aspergillus oryzae]GMG46034.1 unnamed protein product [Aspergillus oryzae var. brunneus]